MEKEFETFRDLSSDYLVNQLKQDKPCCVNFLDYRKYNVKIELIEESNDVLISRLEGLLLETNGFNRRKLIIDEIKKLQTT